MKTCTPLAPFVCMTILYIVVISGVVCVLVTALKRVPPEYGSTLRQIFIQTRFLELTTVLAIIISGTFLALAGSLSQGIVAILSGIGGYVLGGLARSTGKGDGQQPTPPPSAPPPTTVKT